MPLSWKNIKVSKDTRTLKPGDYYVPIKGEKFDGHDFKLKAKAKGAKGVIEEADLYKLAKNKLADIKPFVIGVTGSTGKTTTKDAIGTLLSQKYPVLVSSGNQNTLLGLCLDVINNLTSDHKIFVAEMGMDRLGEIKEICQIIKPNISLITMINETHMEKLKTMENIVSAKGEIFEALDYKGFAIINSDDPNSMLLKETGKGKKVFYSAKEKANFWAENPVSDYLGTAFTLNSSYEGLSNGRVKVTTPLLGSHSVYIILAASAVSALVGLGLSDIKDGIAKLKYPLGRLNILEGVNRSILIDDTYNSSPASCNAAIDVLKLIKSKRKIAIFGDMLELGPSEKEGHKNVGKKLADIGADIFVCIGPRMGLAGDSYTVSCMAYNLKPNVIRYSSSEEALPNIIDKIDPKEGDLILIKGSQGVRMEKVTKLFLEDKASAGEVLVRQDVTWE